MARYKSGRFKFNRPLSTPESKLVYYCYGVHGKGYGCSPPFDSHIRVVCMNQETREVQWADGSTDPQIDSQANLCAENGMGNACLGDGGWLVTAG